MGELDLVLGIDSSTQGTSAVLLRRDDFSQVAEAKLRYRDDSRLAAFGLTGDSPILPPMESGEAHQPPLLFLAALEAILSDLPGDQLRRVAAIDLSAQQHGQVWLAASGLEAIAGLRTAGAGLAGEPDLAARLAGGLAWDRAPIWMEASTAKEAEALRAAIGGAESMTSLSGSDSPLRFSGAVAAHEARRHPAAWRATSCLHLISSFLSAVLSGNPDCPVDWGNGSGMSLMDWSKREWDARLVSAAARLALDSPTAFANRLPPLSHPLAFAGNLAAYFVERFGMPRECKVVIGSGDNPQSKVLAPGILLSLGTSFVIMAKGERPHVSANAMYDGLGRPFMFGCRSNGALSWERVRRDHGLAPDDFAASEEALAKNSPAGSLAAFAHGAEIAYLSAAMPDADESGPRIYQPVRESFPESPSVDIGRKGEFGPDYAGVVDSSLGLVWLGSRPFSSKTTEIAVTGGGSSSPGVLERVASMWRSTAVPIAKAGAATGAALAAAMALLPAEEREEILPRAQALSTVAGKPVEPRPALVEAYHAKNAYLSRLEARAIVAGFRL